MKLEKIKKIFFWTKNIILVIIMSLLIILLSIYTKNTFLKNEMNNLNDELSTINILKEINKNLEINETIIIFMLLLLFLEIITISLLTIVENKINNMKIEDYIELYHKNKNENELIKYLSNFNIKYLLSKIDILIEINNLIEEKDFLLKRIKLNNSFNNLIKYSEFQDYLLIFEKKYIEEYFKEEITEINNKKNQLNYLFDNYKNTKSKIIRLNDFRK